MILHTIPIYDIEYDIVRMYTYNILYFIKSEHLSGDVLGHKLAHNWGQVDDKIEI